ncbi:MAG: hypothetical protein QOK37_1483 [Thermoanaerobaculia bacterium]|nr:hypothetical protein [Thermoanaerobaculia bacterium]
MKRKDLLPKRLSDYIQEMGVRALDHLAVHIDSPSPAAAPEGEPAPAGPASATQTLVDHWKEMSAADKEQFVARVSSSVVEVIIASATLPAGLKKTVKKAEKVLRKRAKKVRKAAARAKAAKVKAAKTKTAQTKPKTKTAKPNTKTATTKTKAPKRKRASAEPKREKES